jgi:hypothetical protein
LNKGGAVDTCNAAAGLIRSAERIIYWQKWRICQERAAAHLAGTTSLHWTPLFPDSTVIQVVAMDGLVMGQVRQDGHRRVATNVGRRPHVAGYDTFPASVLALGRDAHTRKPSQKHHSHGWGEQL